MLNFRLNMQILCDECKKNYRDLIFRPQDDSLCLEGVRIYQEGTGLSPRYVYLLQEADRGSDYSALYGHHLIFMGDVADHLLPSGSSVLVVRDALNFVDLFTLIQDVFDKYSRWDQALHQALDSSTPLDDMMTASLEIFQNPVFIHDPNFYILSCPRTAPGMSVWDKDPRTGLEIAPLSLIHDFRTDLEYLHTLSTTEPSLYSAELRGYRILYINLWNGGKYEGRICVDEIESDILPGHYHALRYLSRWIIESIRGKNLFRLGMGSDLIRFFRDFLDGNIQEDSRIMNCLFFLGWKRYDRYLCLYLETEQPNIQMRSAAATLSYIETQIPGSYAFLYQNGIAVIVNLSFADSKIPDILRSLATLLREELLKMGASSELRDFFLLPEGYLQARTVLQLGRHSRSMYWYYRFEDYLLEYLIKKAEEQLPAELLCSAKLLALKQYDAENHTDFYHTLKVFLELERNVLQTSKSLYIHRSTLFYRLERIQKIADVNLDDAKERLILRVSYYIIEQNEDTSQ